MPQEDPLNQDANGTDPLVPGLLPPVIRTKLTGIVTLSADNQSCTMAGDIFVGGDLRDYKFENAAPFGTWNCEGCKLQL
jgi:hypothetical protein